MNQMFGLLKKKLGDFTQKLKQTIEKKNPEKEEHDEKIEIKNKQIINEKIKPINKEETKLKKQIDNKKNITKETNSKIKNKEIKKDIAQSLEIENIIESPNIIKEKNIEYKKYDLNKTEFDDKRNLKANVGTTGKLKSFFTGNVEIKENDISNLLWELELSLIESDVEQDAAHEIIEQIKKNLVGKKVSSKQIDEILKENIKEIITQMMQTKKIDLIKEIQNKTPYVIMFLGPNGAGKTTSIAKLTYFLQKNKFSCVWAAADTFRSGAIDQLQIHADKLNVKMIKHQYNSDPAAVAFDAIKSAKASKTDVVIIDTAGRQETNKNLMQELKKIERIASPDLKIYVGESYTGQSLVEMSSEFNDTIGIDGFILTKIDTDAKGGTAISLTYKIKKPILYVGTGQEYEDFEEFDTKFIIERII